MTITPLLFDAFLKCPTKCWLRATGETPSGNTYAEWVQAQNESYRADGIKRLLTQTPPSERAESPRSSRGPQFAERTSPDGQQIGGGLGKPNEAPLTSDDLKSAKWQLAVDVLVRTPFNPRSSRRQEAPTSSAERGTRNAESDQSLVTSAATEQMGVSPPTFMAESRLHAVERIPSAGRGKAAQLIPIRFLYRNKLTKDDRLLLAFDALVLSETLGRDITLGKLIHGDARSCARESAANSEVASAGQPSEITSATLSQPQPQILKVKTSALAGEVRKRLEKMTTLLSSPSPPDLVLNRHCGECEFQARCRQKAIETDDLSLLAGMSAKERQKLRGKGIFTVTQLSYTFRPRRRPKRLRDKREKYHHSLKALAIREKKIHIVGSPQLKIEGTPVYLDVEGLPDRDFYYLIGLRIGHGDSAVQHSLWADTVADEGRIWQEFLAILETVDKPVLIHYGSYETRFLNAMKERHSPHPENPAGAQVISEAVNLVSVLFAAIYFPTFSNGLKEIVRGLDFAWSEDEASGLASIFWRQRWEEARAEELRQKLINYNSEDCAALARLEKRLVGLLSNLNGQIAHRSPDVVHADSLPRDFPSLFKNNRFHFAELEQINKAAYWDYQREKVLVRSSGNLKAIASNAAKQNRHKIRVNRIVNWPVPTVCPKCGGCRIYRHQTSLKTVIDLQIGHAGLKRWVTKYRFHYCRCPKCRTVFLDPKHTWNREKYGLNLRAFCVYQNIELRLAQHQVAAYLNRVLGLRLSCANVNAFKRRAAEFYRDTYNALLKSIVSGTLAHADETKVSLHDQDGYVWVFANLEEVVYLYSSSREGDLVQRVLKDFNGVLVSDFYAVYDSLNCAQQKCLIHLIRDINEDLLKEPFNVEHKEMVGEVATLLKPMIETVDRFGLKKRFLRKHKGEVNRFFKRLSGREYRTETALKCQQRLEKSRDTLFTFLNYDGVPWNNNNAEHAVKAFALLRRDFDGVSTEKGIKEYLVLLSVCQTCKYMGVDFLDFLRSGEKDIHAFAESRRGRRRRKPTGEANSPSANEPMEK